MKQRTDQQNRALHLYFRLVAKALNDAGLTVQETLKHQMDMEWNEYRVKELIWRQAQKKYTGKQSTTKLEKHIEIDEIYEHVNRYLASLGVDSIPFPNNEDNRNQLLKAHEASAKIEYPENDLGEPVI